MAKPRQAVTTKLAIAPMVQLDKNWPLDEDLGLWTTTTPMIWRRACIDLVKDTLYSRDDNGSFTLYHRMPGHMSAYTPSLMTTYTPPRSTIFTPVKLVGETLICTHLIDSFLLETQDICRDPS
eukprot:4522691-Ditylum_brightwellii.AAC.1